MKTILATVLLAFAGTAHAQAAYDPMKELMPGCASTFMAHAYTPDDAVRTCAQIIAVAIHPYTGRGTLILEDGTIVDAVDIKPIPGLGKAGKSERVRLLQQRSAGLFQKAEQLPPGQDKWETMDAAEQAEILMMRAAQCAVRLLPTWWLTDARCTK